MVQSYFTIFVVEHGCFLVVDAPGEPKDVAIDKFDRSSVTLKWKPPNDDGGNPIQGNQIRCLTHYVTMVNVKAFSKHNVLFGHGLMTHLWQDVFFALHVILCC